jgi:polysaccharide pyruvyl transferase WcaK-like protein
MRILLAGNHTCGNGGDGAILHGMTDSRQAAYAEQDSDPACCYQQQKTPRSLMARVKRKSVLADDGSVKLNVNTAVAQARETGNRITEELLTVLG